MPTTDIQPAIDRLDATQLDNDTWAYYASETSRWYRLTRADLSIAAALMLDPDEVIRSDAYSHWCATGAGEEMPADWTPDRATYEIRIEARDAERSDWQHP